MPISNCGLRDHGEALGIAREIADGELAKQVEEHEREGKYPRWALRRLGEAGLLGIAFPRVGNIERPFELYVQLMELLASRWLSIGESMNVHVLASYGIAAYGTHNQHEKYLQGILSGDLLGANCLSEPDAGSDLPAMDLRASRDGDSYVLNGTKAWVTHAGLADFYTVYCRTGGVGARGISCVIVDAGSEGLAVQPPDRKMGFHALPTARVRFEDVRVPASCLIGREGRAFLIAGEAMDLGKLGVAACGVGVAQAALEYAARYAKTRKQFGEPIANFQGVSFLLADMATQVAAARELILAAARRHDSGEPCSIEAAMAKLYAADVAMRVTTDAVQILGGCGYTDAHPVERWMREAKLLQIIGGTSQIQRVVISRSL